MPRAESQVRVLLVGAVFALLLSITGCGQTETQDDGTARGEKLQVVTSTALIADVVRNIAGDAADVTSIMPRGADPHSYEPTPRDTAATTDADVLFMNGLGLESTLEPILQNVAGKTETVALSEQVETVAVDGEDAHEDDGEDSDEHVDPHVWMDPTNVTTWTEIIEQTLSELDPANAETYRANAEAYRAKLDELDTWIQDQVAQVPENNRELVTDHTVFAYFAERYGFEQVGAVIPGVSTMAEPSAQEMATLQDAIEEYDVPAIFVGTTVNPTLSEQIAADTGIDIRRVYTGGLSEPDGPAATYLDYMRFNVSTITDALR